MKNSGTIFIGKRLDTPINYSIIFDIDVRFPQVTAVSMLAPSPDWFIGVSGLNLYENGKWVEQISIDLPVYDAGTEGNNELAGTIPGPADGGEGFNAARDDVNVVSRHSGVVRPGWMLVRSRRYWLPRISWKRWRKDKASRSAVRKRSLTTWGSFRPNSSRRSQNRSRRAATATIFSTCCRSDGLL